MTDQTISFDEGHTAPAAVTCSRCGTPLTEYWTVGGAVLCARCRDEALAEGTPTSGSGGRFAKALLFGIGGMVAGAVVWAAIEYFGHVQLALVAILLGYLVGKGVYLGSGNRGGRRYQVLALILTWIGFGLASTPSAIRETMTGGADSAAVFDSVHAAPAADSGRAAAPVTDSALDAEIAALDTAIAKSKTTAPAPPRPDGKTVLYVAVILLILVLSLPAQSVIGSGSIILVVIYAIGLYEAWKLTRATPVVATGPHPVGAPTG